MISLVNVTKLFGNHRAVDKVTLEVAAGEIFGLVGPDGAGKTTIIRMLTGILEPTDGTIVLLNKGKLEAIKGDIGYIPQRFSLYGDLTVIENIELMGSLYGESTSRIADLANEILSFTNLLAFKDRLADNLSGGMKQKLALAAGLMHKPRILFLDEPTTGVDPVSRREFWQMLYRLNKEGMTIFVSTPYMDEAELCDRIAFLHGGRIIICDSPQALCAAYPHRVIELIVNTKELYRYVGDCEILDISSFGDTYHLVVEDADKAIRELSAALSASGIVIKGLKEISPTLEDVFVAMASEVA